ncbi:Ig-like domain-containing protein [Herbiconiux sp. KACC 21604]|uniref:Ig-like domain-containing protein n=1 Tax=unclassified Herbiconiux TaxID=2618217 RepID=UPI0014910D3A|nr:Ig-like domain-containing protein [Herbiconiux sp. SALV-R1]QJU53247.1 fibronectin type III domain-containing protein [Herbiconiux sp. SALV-R1]WPO88206.1 Ig-like domain-containing protein [Herbiconiux sp. KACC 21604]
MTSTTPPRRARPRRSTVLTVAATAALVSLVAVAAVVSDGYTAERMDLDDDTVWVTSELHQAVARANPRVGELNAAVRLDSSSLTVSQFGQTVVVSELGGGEARLLDTARADVDDSFALPVGDVEVTVGEHVSAVLSRTTGDLWVTATSALAAFDPAVAPDLTLGAGGDAVLAPDGTVFAVSPASSTVFTLPAAAALGDAAAAPETDVVELRAGADAAISSVGDTWVVLDRDGGRLLTADRALPVDLGPATTADDDPDARGSVLQTPSAAAPSAPQAALVATAAALIEVPLDGAAPRTVSAGHDGTAAPPARIGSCWYAAWADGSTWSRCGDADPRVGALDGMTGSAKPVFRTNGTGAVVLSDAVTGRSWDVAGQGGVIDDWSALLPDTAAGADTETAVTDETPELDPVQRPPVAVDDELGARPGRSTLLPVLLNDYDPNDDVIVIDSVEVPDGVDWRVDVVSDGQQLQLTLPDQAAGGLAFGYTVSDGRGGTSSATVRVTVRAPGENSPPVQSVRPALEVGLGGRAEVDVRSDWFDPDGDAFYLLSAGTAAPDTVSFTPEGRITFADSGQSTGDKEIVVTVSDGSASTTGTLAVRSAPPEEAPLAVDGWVAQVRVGEEVVLSPLDHVTGGGPQLRLANVPAQEGLTLDADYSGGTVRLTALAAGSHLVEVAVSDSARTASGVVRVIASVPPDASTRPVTVPHSAFARQGEGVLVDVLSRDFDPAGGVLIVTGADAGDDDGLRVEVLEQRMLRVTLTRPAESSAVTLSYTVTNGLAEAEGTVTVIEITDPGVRQPPVAEPDTASVRVGDVVDIPVLANDVHPDGEPLTLAPQLVRGPSESAGLLFTSGDRLRYLAPTTPGDFSAVYRVEAPDGQWATASVTISVRESDPTANAAPVPRPVTARVVAGETVRIGIPLGGVDPDGDSVQFLGVDGAPAKGAVTASGPDWIDFTAGDYSSGTDEIGYTVVDRLGARATGTVRVGIAPRVEGARNPVATTDEVTVRPGRTVLVRVLDNDSDPDGGALSVTSVTPQQPSDDAAADADEKAATVVDDLVSIVAPKQPGRYGYLYEIANERGGTASGFVTLEVSDDAPLSRPVVSDTVVPLADILDSDSVDVDVLSRVFFAEGSARQLWLTVLPSFSGVARVVNGRVRVQVQQEQQIIPFTVAHPDDPNLRSSGFIWVPGLADALPQLRPGAPKLTVRSGSELHIDLDEQVVVVGGGRPVVADPSTVRASHGDGGQLVVDEHTLAFRSEEGYFGPASVSFQVADGTGADARRATLVLPVTVTPRTDQPPVLNGASLELEPGQRRTLDLTRLTTVPGGRSGALGFALLDPRPTGFRAVLVGSSLTIEVPDTAVRGSAGALTVGVSSDGTAGRAGRIDVSVVSSTRPLAVPGTDTVDVRRGTTASVDVLSDDQATNPFPETPLRVVAVRGADAASLPAGLSIRPSADRSQLQVTAAADAAPGDVTVQYQVADATGDPERAVWGRVRIRLLDRPDPVRQLAVTGFGDRTIALSFSPGPANNAPVTGFDVTARSTAGASVTTRCTGTSCVVGTPANGPENAVTLSVVARNAVGASDAAVYAVPVWSDVLPAAPAGLTAHPLDGGLELSWAASTVQAGGSAVRQYDVTVDGRLVQTLDAAGAGCDGAGCVTRVTGLANGSSASVSVTARNGALPALAVWASSTVTGTPYGPPLASVVNAAVDPAAALGSVTLSWAEFPSNGDAVAGYYAQLLAPGSSSAPTGAQACTVTAPAPGSVVAPQTGGAVLAQQSLDSGARSAVFSGLGEIDTGYSFVVWGYNAAGCTASAIATAVATPSPGRVDAAAVSMEMADSGDTVDVRVLSAPAPGPLADPRYRVQRVDAGGAPLGRPVAFTLGGFPRQLTGGDFGENYRFVITACSTWGGTEVCGPASEPVTAPGPSLTFDFGVEPVYSGGVWSWPNGPANGAIVARYFCGGPGAPPAQSETAGTATATSCTPAAPAPAVGDAWLLVAIGDHERVYFG